MKNKKPFLITMLLLLIVWMLYSPPTINAETLGKILILVGPPLFVIVLCVVVTSMLSNRKQKVEEVEENEENPKPNEPVKFRDSFWL